MVLCKSLSFFGALSVLSTILVTISPIAPAAAAPISQESSLEARASSYWVESIDRQGTVAFGESGYTIFRNVMTDYGAKGDGVTDDTDAINAAIKAGGRCGMGCDSSTTTPAIIYFPAGTYLVSAPLVQYYYTQFIGDATNPPTIKASAGFQGIAVIDSDPYEDGGANWYTNQNNFFRQVRNFVIDLTSMPQTAGAGIHWQVAQATSLQNIVFNMIEGAASKQIGIFMDNGSGGFMSDLTFNGGNYGAFFGNQQYTTRNMTFNNCNTAIFMNWNWGWTFKSVTINNCGVGLDMANDPSNQTVGSVILLDTKMTNTKIGVNTSFTEDSVSVPETGGTLFLDNVDCTGCGVAVQSETGSTILAGGSVIDSWGQGRSYSGSAAGTRVQGALTSAPSKPASLIGSNGYIFERSKPQYETEAVNAFVSVKGCGAKGDGTTDDTAAIQSCMNKITSGQILYFDHGAYVVTSTVNVPATIKMTGEIWPLIMASGDYFGDATNPKAVFSIGTAGETGAVEMSDLIFETKGPAPGAVMIQWNIQSAAGDSGMWDTHVRIGGSAGTELQSDTCTKNPEQTTANTACEGAFLMFHATSQSSGVYLENTWFWVADHELDMSDHNQISIYSGRGVLIESQGPVWLYGTSSEHSVFYNYQLLNAKDVFMGMIQSETPYFQSAPKAPAPFTAQSSINDPSWDVCASQNPTAPCYKSWGLRVDGGSNILVYGAGLYSFFEDYAQDCVAGQDCQQNMIAVLHGASDVAMYAVSTKASVNMLTYIGVGVALDSDNRSNFCATIVRWITGS